MSTTISGTFGSGITLSPADYSNNVTIVGQLDVSQGDAIVLPSPWTIAVDGALQAGSGNGVLFDDGGVLDNRGTISASNNAVVSTSGMPFDFINETGAMLVGDGTSAVMRLSGNVIGSSFSNLGTIEAVQGGIGLELGAANATNMSAGLIQGGSAGVVLGNVTTFVNNGTVTGKAGIIVPFEQNYVTIVEAGSVSASSGDAISFASSPYSAVTDELIMMPGASIDGLALGGDVANLDFAGTVVGTIADLGQKFLQFRTISISSGADWEFSGTSQFDAFFQDDGNLQVKSGDALAFDAVVSGSGVIDLAGGAVTFAESVASGITVDFSGPESTLLLDQAHPFLGTIAGFSGGDTIDVTGFGISQQVTGTLAGDVLTLNDGMAPISITFSTPPGSIAVVPIGGTYPKTYEIVVPCFRSGTRLLTPQGMRSVETLRAGDAVITRSGDVRPIIWCGERRVNCRHHPHPETVLPILVEQGSFGMGLPCRDLYLSPDHALWIEDSLVEVKNLVNGVSIRQVDVETVTYHHIELAVHDVVLAEMLPAETYLDCGNRTQFADVTASTSLPVEFASAYRDPIRSCAPLLGGGVKLARIRARLLERIAHIGIHARPGAFSVSANGEVLTSIPCGEGRWCVRLPRAVRVVELESTSSRPAELEPTSTDQRQLGVAVRDLILDGQPVDLRGARLLTGFHEPEQGPTGCFRWTNGAARIDVAGAGELVFTVQAVAPVWALAKPTSSSASREVSASHW